MNESPLIAKIIIGIVIISALIILYQFVKKPVKKSNRVNSARQQRELIGRARK
jgi:hypothetical protein